ncbi:MAG: hypothetical protein GF344_18125 [Chitinivibrionales bacterium]|nr:hypothetical protein [Chitinivibrionales bacterium]MBD3358575.1 hypothetical protein [Chitinivibrionales bacterium]
MLSGPNYPGNRITRILAESDAALTGTFSRVASGERIAKPQDDFGGYVRSLGLESELRDYRSIKQNLLSTKAYSAKAVKIGSLVYEDVAALRELAEVYNRYAPGTDERRAAAVEFEGLKTALVRALNDNTDVYVTGVVTSVDLDVGTAINNFNVQFASAESRLVLRTDVTGLTTLTGTAAPATVAESALIAIDTVAVKAAKFIVGAQQMDRSIDRQIYVVGKTADTKREALAQLTQVDDVEAMLRVVDAYIRREAGLAMLAQANMNRNVVSGLYNERE